MPPRPLLDQARRIADRLAPAVRSAYLTAIARIEARLDDKLVAEILRTGNIPDTMLIADPKLTDAIRRVSVAMGQRTASTVGKMLGTSVQFNVASPRVVMYARDRSATLIRGIGDETRGAIRTILALGKQYGLTNDEQARAIRTTIGLGEKLSAAPVRFAMELEAGDYQSLRRRRLSAVDKAKIKRRIDEGTVDDRFVHSMQKRYTESLRNHRAKTIARTEGQAAAITGQRESIKQAIDQDILPPDLRRFVETVPGEPDWHHYTVPPMNPEGRAMDEPFETPEGPQMHPPFRPNCKCGERYEFPTAKRPGVIR